jgi:putative endonuclease
MITVYVIRDESNKRYVGITNNLSRRLREHRKKQSAGSRALNEFSLIHKEVFPDYASARNREKFLKSGVGRAWLDDNLSASAKGG